MHKSKTYITYSPSHGVQTWFDHVGSCETCEKKDECTNILGVLAEEWQIVVPEGPPTETASFLFGKIMERLNWS